MCSLKDLSTFQTAAVKELRHSQMGTSDVSPLSWPLAQLFIYRKTLKTCRSRELKVAQRANFFRTYCFFCKLQNFERLKSVIFRQRCLFISAELFFSRIFFSRYTFSSPMTSGWTSYYCSLPLPIRTGDDSSLGKHNSLLSFFLQKNSFIENSSPP